MRQEEHEGLFVSCELNHAFAVASEFGEPKMADEYILAAASEFALDVRLELHSAGHNFVLEHLDWALGEVP